jgi:hypothetical protein
MLVAIAEDLEADVTVSEAETTAKRREAVDNRRLARELRARAVRLARDPAPTAVAGAEPDDDTTHCDPPYRFTPDGRKTYLFECLK